MKLVDILARKLKAWPNEYEYISHSKEAGFFASMSGGGCMPLRISDHNFVGQKRETVFRSEWQAAVDALKVAEGIADAEAGNLTPMGEVKNKWGFRRNARTVGELTVGDLTECGYLTQPVSLYHQWVGRAYRFEIKPEWSEDGLPNVGTKCVIYKGSYSLHADAEQFIGPVVTVTARFKSSLGTEMACVEGEGGLGCHVFRANMCFHLPTAEEVAAEEREKAIQSMRDEIGYRRTQLGPCPVEQLYDANYRKQEA